MCGLMKRRLCVFSSVEVAVHRKFTRAEMSSPSPVLIPTLTSGKQYVRSHSDMGWNPEQLCRDCD